MDRLVCFLKCAEILGECQILGYGKVNISVCCCFGARPLKFGIKMLDLVSYIQINIDSIDMLISDLTGGQKVTDFDPRLKSS